MNFDSGIGKPDRLDQNQPIPNSNWSVAELLTSNITRENTGTASPNRRPSTDNSLSCLPSCSFDYTGLSAVSVDSDSPGGFLANVTKNLKSGSSKAELTDNMAILRAAGTDSLPRLEDLMWDLGWRYQLNHLTGKIGLNPPPPAIRYDIWRPAPPRQPGEAPDGWEFALNPLNGKIELRSTGGVCDIARPRKPGDAPKGFAFKIDGRTGKVVLSPLSQDCLE